MVVPAAELFIFLSLFCSNLGSFAALDNCVFLGEEEKNSLYEDGDVVIGGLFPLHYSPVSSLHTYKTKPAPNMYKYFSSRALRWMQTMTFAIKEINQRRDLLPQLKLGFHIHDSCDDIPVSLRASLLLVNGQPETGTRVESCAAVQSTVSPVIIGDAASGVSMALLRSLGSFHIPLVSYFASCSCLSNQREFPTFMRTMPSDAFQIKALAQLVSYFGWTWVGVIGVETDYARFAIQLFLQESVQYGVCSAYTHFYPVVLSQQALDELLDVIQMSSSKVIINFSSESEMEVILREIRHWNITGLQWIASEAWATAISLWEKFGDLLTGTLGFAIRRADVIPGLKQHLAGLRPSNIHESAFLTEFWEELFNCRLNGSMNVHSHGGNNYLDRLPCKGTENLNDVYSPYYDVTQLRVSYNVYKAVYVVAHALQDMSNCKIRQGPFHNGACADPKTVKPWQLMHYMKHVNFSALGEKVNFDQNGDPIAYYDLLNWQRRPDGSLHLVKVGFYDASSPGRSLFINDSVIQWPVGKQASWSVCSDSCPPGYRITRRKGEPICCFDCVPCAEGEVSNETDSLECSRCSEDTWPNKVRDHCIPKTIEFLSYFESMGIVLCVVSVVGACICLSVLAIFFTYKDTPLVRANNMELSFLLLVFLAVCFLVGLLFIGKPSDWLCFSAKYNTYSFMEDTTKEIILFELVQVTKASSSAAMEPVGFRRWLDYLLEEGVEVEVVTTDRSPSIRKIMREDYPDIHHEFDIWHVVKGLMKKLLAVSNRKDNRDLQPWIKSICNHLWYACASCGGDPEEDGGEKTCQHADLSPEQQRRKRWIKKDSPAFKILSSIALDKGLMKDLTHMALFKHTGKLEVFHASLLKYTEKRLHFHYSSMRARTQLAIMDHIENVQREQATTASGRPRFSVVFPKATKDRVARKIYLPTTQTFRQNLVVEALQRRWDSSVKFKDPTSLQPSPNPAQHKLSPVQPKAQHSPEEPHPVLTLSSPE
uniref:vomeronasal type-2 receptor 1-like n=1 Tax=Epinephelus lanceolatus TaxID=310571 RepID=UPI0014487BCE|nr:vomeronasal type-2 receptor 1-like [Epinephelus lanceolatus]